MKKVLFFMFVFLLVGSCAFAIVLSTESGKELFYRYREEVFTTTVGIVLFVFNFACKFLGSKESKCLDESIASASEPVVNAINRMIDGYNKMERLYEEHASTDKCLNQAISVVMAQITFVVEALQTVYANSKNLPQGVKDMVNLKYAKCLKDIGDKEALKQLFEAFRGELAQMTESVSENEPEA